MPYGIPDNMWDLLSPDIQEHARRRVENARQGTGQYGSVEMAKLANMAQWGRQAQAATPVEVPISTLDQRFMGEAGTVAPISTSITDDGGDGSSGGGGFVAPPRPELASSPEWLAYLNSLGLEEEQFRADIERQRGAARVEAERQIAGLDPEYAKQRRGISGALETRGMSRSGEKLRRIAENRATQGKQQSGIQAALTQQLSGLESNLAQKMIDLGSRRADRELQLRSQGYV